MMDTASFCGGMVLGVVFTLAALLVVSLCVSAGRRF